MVMAQKKMEKMFEIEGFRRAAPLTVEDQKRNFIVSVTILVLVTIGSITSHWFIVPQRRLYVKIRSKLLGNIQWVKHIDPDAMDRGWKMHERLSLIPYSLSALYLILEGQFVSALIYIAVGAFINNLINSSKSQAIIITWINRVYCAYLVILLLYVDESSLNDTLRRFAPRICFTSVIAFESLSECVFGTLAFSLALWSRNENYMMPIQYLLLGIIPIQVSGLRELLCMQTIPQILGRLDGISTCSLPVPVIVILFVYKNVGVKEEWTSTAAFRTLALLHVILFFGCTLYSKQFDSVLTPMFEMLSEESEDTVPELLSSSSANINEFLIFSASGIQVSAIYHVFSSGNTHMSQVGMYNKLIVCVLTSIGMVIWSAQYRLSSNQREQRRAVFKAHLCALLFALYCLPECHPHLIVLTTCRLLFAVESRRFSLLQRHNALCGAITLMLVEDHYVGRIVMFIAITTFALGTIGCVAREIVARILEQEKDLQAFIHHQMKQKFSSVGSALEQLQELLSVNPSLSDNILPENQQLLKKALQECKRGGDACSIVDICQGLLNGQFKPTPTQNNLHTVLKEWYDGGLIDVQDFQFMKTCPFELVLDWKLLKLVLNTWIRDAEILTVKWATIEGNSPMISVTFRLSGKRQLGFTNPIMAQALDGRFSPHGHIFTFHARTAASSDEFDFYNKAALITNITSMFTSGSTLSKSTSSTELSSKSFEMEEETRLPQNLLFAVLDDNTLTRRTLEKVIAKKLHGSNESFTRGATVEDCQSFINEIIEKQVDIAIFDESLDYDSEEHTISGTALAANARQNGFKGCAILHSAHAHLCKIPPDIFDGFIAKSYSRCNFQLGVETSWAKHQKKMMMAETSDLSQVNLDLDLS